MMTVAELRKLIENLPDNMLVSTSAEDYLGKRIVAETKFVRKPKVCYVRDDNPHEIIEVLMIRDL